MGGMSSKELLESKDFLSCLSLPGQAISCFVPLWPHDTTADPNSGLNGLGKEISRTVSPNELLLFIT